MSKFYNTTRGSVSATIEGKVAVFPPKAWTSLPDDVELSASMKSLLDQRALIPEIRAIPLIAAKKSKSGVTIAVKKAPVPAPAKPEAKPEAKVKEDPILPSPEKK